MKISEDTKRFAKLLFEGLRNDDWGDIDPQLFDWISTIEGNCEFDENDIGPASLTSLSSMMIVLQTALEKFLAERK